MENKKVFKKIFQSKALVFSLIVSFILLISTEAAPSKVDLSSNKDSNNKYNNEFKPVVRVKGGGAEIPTAQKERFERLIEEGRKLLQEEMDYEGAINKFKEAEALAITRAQKADVLFYLSLAYYATLEEKGAREFNEAVRKLIELDYYRELDMLLCPPRYIKLFQTIKKEYGALKVQSKPPGADVYLNDSKVPAGKTPLTIGCKEGSVKVRVKKGKKEKKEIIKVIAGKETTSPIYILKGGSGLIYALGGIVLAGGVGAAFLFKSKPGGEGETPGATTGSIQVNSSPTGASVFLDDIDTGQTTNCTLSNISPGSHTIKLYKDGYEDFGDLVSVTAGQTATVNANLNAHTITVSEPTSSFGWVKEYEGVIRWQTNGLARSQKDINTNAGLNPLSYPGRNLLPSLHRRAFRYSRSFRDLTSSRRGFETMDSSKNWKIISNRSFKLQDVSKKFSSSVKNIDIAHGGISNIKRIKENNGFKMVNLPVPLRNSSPKHSYQVLKPKGDIRILTLTDVKIDLYKGGSPVLMIASSTENDGRYSWTVDTSLEDGADYKVRVSCVSDSGVYGESDEFQINSKYEFVTKWGSQGSGDGQLIDPRGIAADGSGYVYVADRGNRRIQKFTSSGTFVTKWGSQGSGDGQFNDPEGIAVDNSGYVYVADSDNHCIQKFDSNGNFVTRWGSNGSGDGQFYWPHGVAVDNSGYVYVAEFGNNRIQKFDSNGNFVTKWGSQGNGDGQFDKPRGVAADSSGNVYVLDTDNQRVQKFTSNGTFVTKWPSGGRYEWGFYFPYGIAVDNSGYVYVADMGHAYLVKFNSEGTVLTWWGGFGSGDGQFRGPYGIAVDSNGYVYATDYNEHRVQKFELPSGGQPLIRNNSKMLYNNFINDNFSTNKNSMQRFLNIKSSLQTQNRLKEQQKRIKRNSRKNEQKNEKKF